VSDSQDQPEDDRQPQDPRKSTDPVVDWAGTQGGQAGDENTQTNYFAPVTNNNYSRLAGTRAAAVTWPVVSVPPLSGAETPRTHVMVASLRVVYVRPVVGVA
jgi:hypothetical protein